MNNTPRTKEVVQEMAAMNRFQLAKLWEETFGEPPDPKLWTELMRPVLAYRVQELAYGETPSRLLTQLRRSHIAPAGQASGRTGHLRAGTRIVREWRGVTHEVQVTANGYEYQGEVYPSLSPIANKITGTRWSGPVFFGTKQKAAKK